MSSVLASRVLLAGLTSTALFVQCGSVAEPGAAEQEEMWTGSDTVPEALSNLPRLGSDRPEAPECDQWDPAWIWCDDFERDRLDRYFEFDDRDGSFVRKAGVGRDGGTGLEARFAAGQVAAGSLKIALGRTPGAYFRPIDDGVRDYRELYWRFYLRNEPGWTGGGGHKLTRATVFTSESWSQAMIAHLWAGSPPHEDRLLLDPASGVNPRGSRVRTRRYNDFANLRWLGIRRGRTAIFGEEHLGRWHCIEVRVRLNEPGRSDGAFEFWINGESEARATGLDWMGAYTDYGVNAIFLENYWDDGAPQHQRRYFDNLVVSTERIGCRD